ncbi:hypothetical protein [Agrobacterium burrii]
MQDNVDTTDIHPPISSGKRKLMNVTSSTFEDQRESLNMAERDDVSDYLKSYQKAQAAALLSHSASATHQRKAAHGPGGDLGIFSGQSLSHASVCPSRNSCARIRSCAPVSSVQSTPRKTTSIFKLVASRLKRFGRKSLSGFRKMPAAANSPLSHATAIALARREASNTGPDAKPLRRR